MTPDDWQKVAGVAAPAGAAGAIVSVLAGVIQRKRTLVDWLIGSIAGALAATGMALALHDSGWPIAIQGLLIGIAAYNAADVLEAVRQIVLMFRNDPLAFVERVWKAIRGGGGK